MISRFIALVCALFSVCAAQLPDGRIVFSTAAKKDTASSSDTVSWEYRPTRWGMYDVEIAGDGVGDFQVEVAGKKFFGAKAGNIGRVYIAKAEPFSIQLRGTNAAKVHSVTLSPAPEGQEIVQKGTTIPLRAADAITHSVTMRYEPATNKNCLGYWVKTNDVAEWRLTVNTPGKYQIELWQGCGNGQGGSDVLVEVRDGEALLYKTVFVVAETGHFQIFLPRDLGRVTFPKAGQYSLWVKPQRKQAGAIMDIRQVLLTAAGVPLNDAAKRITESKRVLFLGDSITYSGEYVEFVEAYLRMQYPDSTVEMIDLGLPSETVSGLSEPGHAGGSFPRPDLHERLGRVLEKGKPDQIFACYGMNDGIYYPFSEERLSKFQEGIKRLRERASAAGAKVVHLTPPTFDPVPLKGRTLPAGLAEYRSPYEGYNEVLDRYSEWLVQQRANGWEVIDTHTPMNRFLQEHRRLDPKFILASDGVHANTQGHWLIARELLRYLGAPEALTGADNSEALRKFRADAAETLKLVQQRQRLLKDAWLTFTGHVRPGMNNGKPMPEAQRQADEIAKRLKELNRQRAELPGNRSLWYGFERFDFEVQGKMVSVVAPKIEAPGRPWMWEGEFFGHKPNPDLALLGRGFHVVYLSVPDMLGSPQAVKYWNACYETLTEKFGFAKKAALTGLSRGGLYCYNWAIANPEKTACIYADAPVCDFKSWPGAFGKGKRSERDWQLVLDQYGFKSDEEAKAYTHNPVDNLAPLADAKVPLLHVFGDADEVVPWEENTGLLAERYKQLGGEITLIRKPGVKHHPHGLDDSVPIVDFIWSHTANQEAKAWLNSHGGGPVDENSRPLIRKMGTIDLNLVETTPVVINNRLWRFEWVRQGVGQQYWDNKRQTNYFRFRNVETGEVTPAFADGYEFGSAFVYDGTVFVTGTFGRSRVNMFASRDLNHWESWPVIDDGRYGIFNTSLCQTATDFVLMFEVDKPREEAGVPFTARFARSKDLRSWTLTPPECNYTRERYSAPHALRWRDGWFYDFYLEAHDGYEMRVVRSRDLIQWEPSPLNPVLRHSAWDKVIANSSLDNGQRGRIANALNINNSDIDFCEWQGRLAINYSWGNQQGTEHLAAAVYDGSLAQFLKGWFPEN